MCVMPRVWRLIQGGYAIVKERETFASRLGFVLISGGCGIGVGNVWRFPYIVGQSGGAAFVLAVIAGYAEMADACVATGAIALGLTTYGIL